MTSGEGMLRLGNMTSTLFSECGVGLDRQTGALIIEVCAKCWICGLLTCCLRPPLRHNYKAASR